MWQLITKCLYFMWDVFDSSAGRQSKDNYETVSRSFRTGRLERELQMVQLSATMCSCIATLWVSLVSFASITLCVASQRVFISVYSAIDSVRKLLDTPSDEYFHSSAGECTYLSPPSGAEVKSAWSYTSTTPIRLHCVVLSWSTGTILPLPSIVWGILTEMTFREFVLLLLKVISYNTFCFYI
jgi:hypothetical protein